MIREMCLQNMFIHERHGLIVDKLIFKVSNLATLELQREYSEEHNIVELEEMVKDINDSDKDILNNPITIEMITQGLVNRLDYVNHLMKDLIFKNILCDNKNKIIGMTKPSVTLKDVQKFDKVMGKVGKEINKSNILRGMVFRNQVSDKYIMTSSLNAIESFQIVVFVARLEYSKLRMVTY